MFDSLIDSNILGYAFVDKADNKKSVKAARLVESLAASRRGAVAVQNIAEFANICLRKSVPPLPVTKIQQLVTKIQDSIEVLVPSKETVPLALYAVKRYQLSFWDAMLWAVAKENSIPEILSEDMQHGQNIEGVKIRNPFK